MASHCSGGGRGRGKGKAGKAARFMMHPASRPPPVSVVWEARAAAHMWGRG